MGPISTPSRAALLRCISSCVMGVLICLAYIWAQVHMAALPSRQQDWGCDGHARLFEACRAPCRWAATQAAPLHSSLSADFLASVTAQGLQSHAAGSGRWALHSIFCIATLTGMKSSDKSLVPIPRLVCRPVPSMRPGCAAKRRSRACDWGEGQGDPPGADRDAGISAREAGSL